MLADFEIAMITTFVNEHAVGSLYRYPRRDDEALFISIVETAKGMRDQYGTELLRNHGAVGHDLWDKLMVIIDKAEAALDHLPPVGSRLLVWYVIVEYVNAATGQPVMIQPRNHDLQRTFRSESEAIEFLERYADRGRSYGITTQYEAH